MKIKICQKCKKEFNPRSIINGKIHSLYRRTFCLECSPYGSHNTTDLIFPAPQATINKLSVEQFYDLVKSSNSRSDIFFKLRLRKSGEAFKIINRRFKKENIDVSHFIKGCHTGSGKIYSDEEVYCVNSNHKHIRARVISDKIMEYKCGKCSNGSKWMNEELTLALDHINGDRYDNRKENLRFLCPNCHSQTNTFGKKKRI